MARILRGDILWADPDPVRGREQGGRRPILVLSHEIFNAKSQTVIALLITSKPQRVGFPLAYPLGPKDLPQPSWVKIGQIRTLSVERLGRKAGHLDALDVDRIVEGLFDLIGP